MKTLILILLTFCVAIAWEPWLPVPRTDAWWQARFNSNVQNTQSNAANIGVIFYGDSIVEGWSSTGVSLWNQHFAPLGAANYGIGGDLVQHLLWRSVNGEITHPNLNPRLVVLKIGELENVIMNRHFEMNILFMCRNKQHQSELLS